VTVRPRALPLALLPALLLGPGAPRAGEPVRVAAELLVPAVQRLESGPGILALPDPTSLDLERGHVDALEPLVFTVHSNTPWELAFRVAASPGKGPAPRAAPPAVAVAVADGPFQPLGPEWRTVAAGDSPAAGEEIRVRVRLAVGWLSVAPGHHQPDLAARLQPREG
jgi:hypothetical protein